RKLSSIPFSPLSIIHRIVDHVPTIIQGIVNPIPEDIEGSHILHEGE
ncbi:19737_t:CDS:2, partial [Funneliformis geosporum]